MDKLITPSRILVVEDDALIRDYVAGLLMSESYEVTTAADGRGALDLIDAGLVPDLLFTDVMIAGGMSGFELARKAQAILPGLKVLFTSGYVGATGEELLPPGAVFLPKPFRRLRCIEMVQGVLAN